MRKLKGLFFYDWLLISVVMSLMIGLPLSSYLYNIDYTSLSSVVYNLSFGLSGAFIITFYLGMLYHSFKKKTPFWFFSMILLIFLGYSGALAFIASILFYFIEMRRKEN